MSQTWSNPKKNENKHTNDSQTEYQYPDKKESNTKGGKKFNELQKAIPFFSTTCKDCRGETKKFALQSSVTIGPIPSHHIPKDMMISLRAKARTKSLLALKTAVKA
jgi:hypothetical protein